MITTRDILYSLHHYDEIVLTGTATSPVRRFVNLHAMVATVSVPTDDDGKIWFPFDQIEGVRVIGRADED